MTSKRQRHTYISDTGNIVEYMTFIQNVSNNCMKMAPWPYKASENLAADKGHLVLQFYMIIIAYTQQFSDMADLFETSANCTVGI